MIKKNEDYVERITFILLNQLMAKTNAQYEGLVELKRTISNFVINRKPIKLLLPAFPCKTNNLDKVLGHQPDMAEYQVLKKFIKTIRDIQSIYPYGVCFYIFSDYHTFSYYINVDFKHHYDYSDGLKKMIDIMNGSDVLKIVNFGDFAEFSGVADVDYFDELKRQYGDAQYEMDFEKLKRQHKKMHSTYLGLKKFMSQDQKYPLAALSYSNRRKRLAEMAKGMMIQGRALDNFLHHHFADCIRLSIHEHPMVGEKYSLYLFDEPSFKTPWHSTLMFDAHLGEFVVDSFVNHSHERSAVVTVTYQGQPWCLLKLHAISNEALACLRRLTITVHQEQFGLVLSTPDPDMPIELLQHRDLTHLAQTFGYVTLRGFHALESTQEFESWYRQGGGVVSWPEGNTQIVRPSLAAKGTSVHWGLVYPLDTMNVNQDKYDYDDYTPDEVVFYCHQTAGGMLHYTSSSSVSRVINSELATLVLNGDEREALRETVLAYSDGVSPRQCTYHYPVIMSCPQTRKDILRWWMETNTGVAIDHLPSHDTELYSSNHYTESKDVITRLHEICRDRRVYHELSLQAGDVVVMNNHATLRAVESIHDEHELWYLQRQPTSVNSPWQPYNAISNHQPGLS